MTDKNINLVISENSNQNSAQKGVKDFNESEMNLTPSRILEVIRKKQCFLNEKDIDEHYLKKEKGYK